MRTIQAALTLAFLCASLPSGADAQMLARATRTTIGCVSNAELSTIARLRREGRPDQAEAYLQRALANDFCRTIPAGEQLVLRRLYRDPSFGDFYAHQDGSDERVLFARAADLELIDGR